MELRQIEGLYQPVWHKLPIDQWADDLRRACGHFRPVPLRDQRKVLGCVETRHAGGLDFAHVVKDLSRIERTREDARRDDNDCLFLIVQLGGEAGMEQFDRQTVLRAGDCILVDSARPSTFNFHGRFSNQLSVHLPRQLMYSASLVRFVVGQPLDRRDPMALTIRSLIAKIMMMDVAGRSKPHLSQLLFDTVRYAFEFEDVADPLPHLAASWDRIDFVEDLIDRNLTDPDLSPAMVAARLGHPLRRIQEDFQQAGLTLNALIRQKRLKLAAQRLGELGGQGQRINIAQIAYMCGFNDISYFNRSFREHFGSAPSDYLRALPRVPVQ
ncbi:helix-turn-helix domain-containing protein [Mesorhizobium sp. ISC25]|uniref:helix-turn-helix domain-containing protein n=1 Tax=Mesorhizobium sp. ISC25 TaxID=3077335 RepID=UPI0035D9523F